MAPLRTVFLRLPAYAINGLTVALGIGLIQLLAGGLGGAHAALVASSGAVFASLADMPNATHRTWRRVATAALLGCLISALANALARQPLAMGALMALCGFISAMVLAWGLRAASVSFAGILAVVFTAAAPSAPDLASQLRHLAWTAFGAGAYTGWAVAAAALVQPRLRTLSLAVLLEAAARLLRARAGLLQAEPGEVTDALPLQTWIRDEAALDDRLQVARDLLFAAPSSPHTERQSALLLEVIQLRETFLASELDLELLGGDRAAAPVVAALAQHLLQLADGLADMARALTLRQPLAPGRDPAATVALEPVWPIPPANHLRLTEVLVLRARHMAECVGRMQALMQGGAAQVPLSRDDLQLFVSVEGWPLAALRPHLTLRSPVLRHAVRAAVALGCAYWLGSVLPWASHPHWLVLSVAVVLRGNLEQTLSRRNLRVAGTVIGCLLVMALAQAGPGPFAALIFLLAVALAHAFATRQYLVTAVAATVMALLQAHLADPTSGFAITERLADTVLGAALAWAFSFVLPSWEHRALPRLVGRVTRGMARLTGEALQWPQGAQADVALRLARREVYEALGALAASAQRTSVEPLHVRLPLYGLADLLMRSRSLLAQLAAIRVLVHSRAAELDAAQAGEAMQAAAAEIQQRLEADGAEASAGPLHGRPGLPVASAIDAPWPWLLRRLHLAQQAAADMAYAARALRKAASS
ncbi:MAG: FUSC family protein [Burkholderiales bacterium]